MKAKTNKKMATVGDSSTRQIEWQLNIIAFYNDRKAQNIFKKKKKKTSG